MWVSLWGRRLNLRGTRVNLLSLLGISCSMAMLYNFVFLKNCMSCKQLVAFFTGNFFTCVSSFMTEKNNILFECTVAEIALKWSINIVG